MPEFPELWFVWPGGDGEVERLRQVLNRRRISRLNAKISTLIAMLARMILKAADFMFSTSPDLRLALKCVDPVRHSPLRKLALPKGAI